MGQDIGRDRFMPFARVKQISAVLTWFGNSVKYW